MKFTNQVDRRAFLSSFIAATLAASTVHGAIPLLHAERLVSLDDFKQHLRGPIVSLPTPFREDFSIDHDAIDRMIRRALDHDMEIFELTPGNSEFAFLSYEEIKQVTRTMVDVVGGRGLTIAATDAWWTGRAVEFARYAESIGATALQVRLPEGNADSLVRHYEKIARSTRLPLILQGNYPIPLLDELVKIESIVALKEDVDLEYVVETTSRFGKRLNCFAGGSYEWYIVGQPYGATTYFDTYATFAPKIAADFWKAVRENDLPRQVAIDLKYDRPFLKNFSHSWWHATLEYFGVAKRFLRPPQHSYTDQEMIVVKNFFDRVGLTPGAI